MCSRLPVSSTKGLNLNVMLHVKLYDFATQTTNASVQMASLLYRVYVGIMRQ